MDIRTLLIGALLVAAVVLGYLYYESQKNTVEVEIGAAHTLVATRVTPC